MGVAVRLSSDDNAQTSNHILLHLKVHNNSNLPTFHQRQQVTLHQCQQEERGLHIQGQQERTAPTPSHLVKVDDCVPKGVLVERRLPDTVGRRGKGAGFLCHLHVVKGAWKDIFL